MWLMHSLVTSIFLYACESWTLTAELQNRIQAMELRCYHKILHISCKDHVTNEEVCAKIRQVIGPHKDLQTTIKEMQTAVIWSCLLFIRSGQNHLARQKPSSKAQWTGGEDKADRGRGGKTISGNGQAWSSLSPRGQWRTGENGENWLRNHLWCSNDPYGYRTDEMRAHHLNEKHLPKLSGKEKYFRLLKRHLQFESLQPVGDYLHFSKLLSLPFALALPGGIKSMSHMCNIA